MKQMQELTKINSEIFSLLIKATGLPGYALIEANFKETPLLYINEDFELNKFDLIKMYSLIIDNMNTAYTYCVDEYSSYKRTKLYSSLSEIKKKLNSIISEIKE